ncbi:hypothetical protein BDQ17DRAFT_1365813 [Cyathus striatus]|nr:hypothetical protein BDQ17DRAFT_1365813 [Cyathus striatus]
MNGEDTTRLPEYQNGGSHLLSFGVLSLLRISSFVVFSFKRFTISVVCLVSKRSTLYSIAFFFPIQIYTLLYCLTPIRCLSQYWIISTDCSVTRHAGISNRTILNNVTRPQEDRTKVQGRVVAFFVIDRCR